MYCGELRRLGSTSSSDDKQTRGRKDIGILGQRFGTISWNRTSVWPPGSCAGACGVEQIPAPEAYSRSDCWFQRHNRKISSTRLLEQMQNEYARAGDASAGIQVSPNLTAILQVLILWLSSYVTVNTILAP